MLAFLIIKDGREDQTRRKEDKKENNKTAKYYSYGILGFTEKPIQDLLEGDTVLVYNNEEVPADMILISTFG